MMNNSNRKPLSVYTFVSLVFIIASASIAVIKLTALPPEYTLVAAALLFGAVGALQCMNLQKRHDQLKALEENLEEFKLTTTAD